MSKEDGPSPEYPDVRPIYPRYYAGGFAPDLPPDEVERIAEEHSQDEALGKRHPPSFWRRLFGRRKAG